MLYMSFVILSYCMSGGPRLKSNFKIVAELLGIMDSNDRLACVLQKCAAKAAEKSLGLCRQEAAKRD